MANTLTLNGYFGVKQAFHVSDPVIATGWYAGYLFNVASIGLSGAGVLQGAVGARGPFVGLNATSGAAIAGVAMENSSDESLAVAGMSHPSGSKVTLLHGHSTFFIDFGGTATSATTRQSTGAPWEVDIESASLMDMLYASSNAKFCEATGGDAAEQDTIKHAIGHCTQVPAAGNSWTLGVTLYG